MFDEERNPFAKGQLAAEATERFLRIQELERKRDRADGELEAARAELDRWLARGAMHRKFYNEIVQTFLMGGSVNWDNLPAPRPIRGTVIRTRFAIAASVMLVGFLIWRLLCVPMASNPQQPVRVPVTASRSMPQLLTKLGEVRRVRLSDGSLLTLDTDTLVSVDYRSDERQLRLERGRARFDVAHDGRPFVVDAGDNEIVAHGTVFDVSLLERDQVRVNLFQGTVEVRRDDRQRSRRIGQLAVLRGGESVRLTPDKPVSGPVRLAPEDISDWPGGVADFDHATLAEVVSAANRYSTTKLKLSDPVLEDIAVSGVFRINDPVRLANALGSLFHLRVDWRPGEVILSPRGK